MKKQFWQNHYSNQYLERLIGSRILKKARVPRRNNDGAIIKYKSDTKDGQHRAGDIRMCRPHSVTELFKYYKLVKKPSSLDQQNQQNYNPNPFNNDNNDN